MKAYTRILSDYLAELKYEDLPADVVERAKYMVLHTVGASIAAHPAEAAKRIVGIAKNLGTGAVNATIIGDGSKISIANALLANGTLADLLDWEDCSWTGHPSSGAVPAAIAVSEAYHKTGKEFLTALVGAYEVYQRIAMALNPTEARFKAGWGLHCWQIFAPAAAIGKLMGFTGDTMCKMLGTAGCMTPVTADHLFTSDFYHTMWGMVDKNAMECALITEQGVSELTRIFEHDRPYWPYVTDQCDWDWFDKGLGERYLTKEIMIKNWPVNMWIESPMDMIDSLYRKHGFDPDEIERIEVAPYIPFRSEPCPENGYDSLLVAQFSIPFCLAMYFRGPKRPCDWLDPKYLKDPAIIDMAKRVVGIGVPGISHYNHFVSYQHGGYLTYDMKVVMKDGTEYTETLEFPKGHPRNPFDREGIIENFRLQTNEILTPERQDAFVDFVFNKLENTDDMAVIADYLKV